MDETSRTCLWCSAKIPAGATACPQCGAHVEGADVPSIPGVTDVDFSQRLGDEGRLPDSIDASAWMSAGKDDFSATEEAILPPSEAVRREMRKIQLEAEIENAGRAVMSATGDEAIEVGMPSREAMEAYEQGLLDGTGPAGETDFAERARELEQEDNR